MNNAKTPGDASAGSSPNTDSTPAESWGLERIYDEQIAPLMTQIIAICQEHEIPLVATFEYEPNECCSTVINIGRNPDTVLKGMYRAAMGRGSGPLMVTSFDADGKMVDSTAILGG